jgi:hypothetical protein
LIVNFNIIAVVNTGGQVVERYIYNPYGTVTVLNADWTTKSLNASAVNWQYLHQGGRFDSIADLYSFRNRDYSPTMER